MTLSARLLSVLMALLLFGLVADTATFAQKKTTRRKAVRKVPAKAAAEPAKPVAPIVAKDTEIKIRLKDDIDTAKAQDGDKFTAVVLEPSKFAEATIDGHIAAVKQSGNFKGQTALSLSFDTINFSNGTNRSIAAQIIKVYDAASAKNVDKEGNIESGDKTKTTIIRTGGGAAAGAAIGGAIGGGKGAGIGALAGAALGAGSTYIQGANKIKLDRGTEILIITLK